MSLPCPDCGSGTKVIDSRSSCQGMATRRRLACMDRQCGMRFTTYETARANLPIIEGLIGVDMGLYQFTECAPVWP